MGWVTALQARSLLFKFSCGIWDLWSLKISSISWKCLTTFKVYFYLQIWSDSDFLACFQLPPWRSKTNKYVSFGSRLLRSPIFSNPKNMSKTLHETGKGKLFKMRVKVNSCFVNLFDFGPVTIINEHYFMYFRLLNAKICWHCHFQTKKNN